MHDNVFTIEMMLLMDAPLPKEEGYEDLLEEDINGQLHQ